MKTVGIVIAKGKEVERIDRELTPTEEADNLAKLPTLADLVNDKYQEITEDYQADDKSVFAGYTEEQQKTFYKQEHEAREWLKDVKNLTPFIDGMVLVGWRTKQELVDRIVIKADILSFVYGALIEKYQYLREQLINIDINGDVVTEKAKIDVIIW